MKPISWYIHSNGYFVNCNVKANKQCELLPKQHQSNKHEENTNNFYHSHKNITICFYVRCVTPLGWSTSSRGKTCNLHLHHRNSHSLSYTQIIALIPLRSKDIKVSILHWHIVIIFCGCNATHYLCGCIVIEWCYFRTGSWRRLSRFFASFPWGRVRGWLLSRGALSWAPSAALWTTTVADGATWARGTFPRWGCASTARVNTCCWHIFQGMSVWWWRDRTLGRCYHTIAGSTACTRAHWWVPSSSPWTETGSVRRVGDSKRD